MLNTRHTSAELQTTACLISVSVRQSPPLRVKVAIAFDFEFEFGIYFRFKILSVFHDWFRN